MRAHVLMALALLVALGGSANGAIFRDANLPAPAGHINHAPGLVELPSGALLLCWYSGTTEANADTVILCSDSRNHGLHWETPRQAVGVGERSIGAVDSNKSLGNVALTIDSAGRLWMIYGVVQRWKLPLIGNLCFNWYCGRVDARMSLDAGQSWQPAIRLDNQVGALPRAKPLHHPALGDLVPLYREGSRTAYVRLLDLAAARPGETPSSRVLSIPGNDMIQPSLVLLQGGQVRAYLRDSTSKSIRTATLDPTTATWSEAHPTNVPNPDSGLDAFTDDTGALVVITNPGASDRHALSLFASRDGLHFDHACTLVAADTQGDVAYPTVIRAHDGIWHVAYSAEGKTEIHEIEFDAAWLHRCLGT